MTMQENFSKSSKLFLSDKASEGSSVRWSITASPGATYLSLDSEVVITDCHKQVALDFCAYADNDIKGRLDKIDTFIRTLQEFRDSLQEADKFLAVNKPKKKKKKKRKVLPQ